MGSVGVDLPGFKNVIIVGAGPSGMLLALRLAQSKIPVTLIDKQAGLDPNPRATHYGPAAMIELNKAGVGQDIRARGFSPQLMSWRKLDGSRLSGLTLGNSSPDDMAVLAVNEVTAMLRDRARELGGVEFHFDHKVVNIGQDENEAWVEVDTPTGSKTMRASYVIGCDGATSQIRKSLFSEEGFPGKTWQYQVVATNTYYNFDQFGWHDCNFIVHPEHWFMAARISKEGLWRVSYGEQAGLTDDQLRERQPWKFKEMLPGHPDPDAYRVINFSPYKIHQRLAKSMKVGRFLLAADAAHLCNPFGGLGLTGGIVDVGGLADCLSGMYENKADASILDKYNEIRSRIYNEVTNPISSENLVRLCEQDPEKAMVNDEFLQLCKQAETDTTVAKQIREDMFALQHDFTQYYHGSQQGQSLARL